MKYLALIIFSLLSLSVLGQVEKYIPPRPTPPRLVNDFAKLLTEEQKQHLENKLVAYDDSTSNQIAIVTVESLSDYSAVEYAVALGRAWGVGGKENDNGVVILVSTGGGEGNREAFIAIGYGLEGAIPDATANAILESELISGLRSGNYYGGFDRAIDAIMRAAAGEYKAPKGYKKDGDKGISFGKILVIIILIIIMIARSGGGRGGGFASRRGYRGFGPTIFGGGLGGGGWSGGGGFGGGGFGGFGGGSFGGGGAGGRW